MKNIFIISSYPSTHKKLSILKDCLKSIKNMNFDILLTTNYPINDPEIYELVDYFLWDKTDIQTLTDYDISTTMGWYMDGLNFRAISSFDNAYHFDLYRSLYNGINFAKGLGYEFFYYLEGDCIIINKDIISGHRDKMFKENKKLIFVEINLNDEINKYTSYMTHIFGGIPSYFLESFIDIPYDIDKWSTTYGIYNLGMEIIFYENIKNKDIVLKLKYEDFSNAIDFNKIKKNDTYGFKYMFFFDNNDDMYLLIHNNMECPVKVKFEIDNKDWFSMDFGIHNYYIEKLEQSNFLNKKIKETIIREDEIIIFEKMLDEKKMNNIKKHQRINFF